jgi:4-hydroxy-tetrahydrodipicolinate synthase
MITHPTIKGSGVAIITPFDAKGNVDEASLRRLVNHLADGGIDVLVALGTTGESVTLTKDEKRRVQEIVLDENAGRCSVMLGIGGNNTNEVAENLQHADLHGIEAVLSVAPYYNKPNQEGHFQHYKIIAEASPKPLLLYNVPGRTGVNMSAETTLRIAHECQNVCGIKEASGNMEQIMQIIRQRPNGFLVISGDDALTFPLIACGADGVISVVANAYPALFSEMVHRSMDGDFLAARPIHLALLEFTRLMFADGSPAGIKAALKLLNICDEFVRLPLVTVRADIYQAIEKEMQHLKHIHIQSSSKKLI